MASQTQAKPPSITWDEVTIAEHDKDRGTRQKIDEPDTPYAKYDADADPDREARSPEMKPVAPTSLMDGLDELNAKLAAAAEGDRDPEARLGWVAEMEDAELKSREFAAKRNAHYNMAGVLGRNFDDEDDDDDDDDDDEA